MNEIYTLFGDISFIIAFPVYVLLLFVSMLLIQKLVGLFTPALFNQKGIVLSINELSLLSGNLSEKTIFFKSLLTLFLYKYIKINNRHQVYNSNILVDINSFNDPYLILLYKKLSSIPINISTLMNDEELYTLSHKICNSTKCSLTKKSLIKSTSYYYYFLIFIPIFAPAILKASIGFSNSTCFSVLVLEVVGIIIIFPWLLFVHISGKTLLGSIVLSYQKKVINKKFSDNKNDPDTDLLLELCSLKEIYRLRKIPEISKFLEKVGTLIED